MYANSICIDDELVFIRYLLNTSPFNIFYPYFDFVVVMFLFVFV